MTAPAYRWKCPKCGWQYESPIGIYGCGCPHHKGKTVTMKPDDEDGGA